MIKTLPFIKIFIFFLCCVLYLPVYAQVGIGTTNPDASSVLDVNSTSKGVLPPRLTTAQRDAITNPATGLIVFCTDCDSNRGCLSINLGVPASPNWTCVGTNSASVFIDCSASSFIGNCFAGIAVSGMSVRFSITNNSFSPLTAVDFSSAVSLSGAGASGLSIPAGQNNSVNIAVGQTVLLSYNITGTPSSGTITATFNRLGLNCVLSTSSQLQPPTINCSGITVTGLSPAAPLANGVSYTGTVTVPYTVATNGLSYTSETVTVNGLTLTRSAGSYTAPSGNIIYTISGTHTGTNQSENFTLTFGSTVCNNVLVGTMRTCKDLIAGQPSGTYTIDPDGSGPNAPFHCYCDNVNNGGGWTLVAVRQNAINIFNETLTSPLLTSATSGRTPVWSSTNTSFNFTDIRYTNNNNEYAIATFGATTTLNALNTTYATYTSTSVPCTVTSSDGRLVRFYFRGQSGANVPYNDSSDWAYMAFSAATIGTLGDSWDTVNPWWILAGTDNTNNPMTTSTVCGKVNVGFAGGGAHWSSVNTTNVTVKTYVWLK